MGILRMCVRIHQCVLCVGVVYIYLFIYIRYYCRKSAIDFLCTENLTEIRGESLRLILTRTLPISRKSHLISINSWTGEQMHAINMTRYVSLIYYYFITNLLLIIDRLEKLQIFYSDFTRLSTLILILKLKLM